jgi:hypothetical protein
MIINGTWAYQMYKDALGDNLGLHLCPKLRILACHLLHLFLEWFFSLPIGGDKQEQDIALGLHQLCDDNRKHAYRETNFSVMPANVSLLNSLMMSGESSALLFWETAINANIFPKNLK